MRSARIYQTASTGVYHIFSRGVEKREIFHTNEDYVRFTERLEKYAKELGVDLYISCLMPNHFHFLLYSEDLEKISKLLQRLCTAYAVYYNRRYGRVGHLFQNRFQCKPVESEEYFQQLHKYIKENPQELGIMPEKYPWLNLQGQSPEI